MSQDPIQKEIQQIHLSLESAKELVKLGQEALALAENTIFEKLVLKGYFIDEAARLVHLFGDPTINADVRGKIERDLHGPSSFKRYLQTMVARGRNASQEIESYMSSLEELHQMDAEDEAGESIGGTE